MANDKSLIAVSGFPVWATIIIAMVASVLYTALVRLKILQISRSEKKIRLVTHHLASRIKSLGIKYAK